MSEILIVIIATAVSPLILAIVTFMFQRQIREREWERQDEVAKKVEQVAVDAKATSDVVNEVHLLVNSRFTSLNERIEQLVQALTTRGIEIPPDPSVKVPKEIGPDV